MGGNEKQKRQLLYFFEAKDDTEMKDYQQQVADTKVAMQMLENSEVRFSDEQKKVPD